VNQKWHLTLAAAAAAAACWINSNSQHCFKKGGNSLKGTTA